MTLILGSQVRMDLGGFIASAKATGGNAIKHYNILTVEMSVRSVQAAGNWPYTYTAAGIPPDSFPVNYKLIKSKMMNRYKGCSVLAYFVRGKLDDKFNILAVAKEIGLTDGKKIDDLSFKGFNDMYKRISDEKVEEIKARLLNAYTNYAMGTKNDKEEHDDDIVIPIEELEETVE